VLRYQLCSTFDETFVASHSHFHNYNMPSIAEAKERDHAGVQLVNDAIEDAHGAWVDGRMENVIFKHKQLYALFCESVGAS
jgi:hypothetical protein